MRNGNTVLQNGQEHPTSRQLETELGLWQEIFAVANLKINKKLAGVSTHQTPPIIIILTLVEMIL